MDQSNEEDYFVIPDLFSGENPTLTDKESVVFLRLIPQLYG